MKEKILGLEVLLFVLIGVAAGWATEPGIELSPGPTLTYPQTPTFVDQTAPGANSSVDTVAGLRRQDRLDNGNTGHRERLGEVTMIYVAPGGLEPALEYKFALADFLRVEYRPGTFSFAGPADALAGITSFGWGVENNNNNFLPLLIRADYQNVKTPTLEFTWQMPQTFSSKNGTITQTSAPITLNYNFKVPLKGQTTWGDAPQYVRFNAAAPAFGKSPNVKSYQLFRWNHELETFTDSLDRPLALKNQVTPPQGRLVEGFAVIAQEGMTFLAFANRQLIAYDEHGKPLWTAPARAPILPYRNRWLLTVSDDYQSLLVLSVATGTIVASLQLPDFLPQYENAMITIGTGSGDLLLFSVPNQSRLLAYRLAVKP